MDKNTPHYAHPTGFALGITAGILYIICALLVLAWPMQTVKFFSLWFHGIDLTRIAVLPQITIGMFLTGLIGIVLAGYLVGVLYSWVYNKCVVHCKRKGWI